MTCGRRHHFLGVSGYDTSMDFALFGVPGNYRTRFSRIVVPRSWDIEPKLGLSCFFVRTMALETMVRQYWADIEVEVHPFRGTRHERSRSPEEEATQQQHQGCCRGGNRQCFVSWPSHGHSQKY